MRAVEWYRTIRFDNDVDADDDDDDDDDASELSALTILRGHSYSS